MLRHESRPDCVIVLVTSSKRLQRLEISYGCTAMRSDFRQ